MQCIEQDVEAMMRMRMPRIISKKTHRLGSLFPPSVGKLALSVVIMN
jgi:hypothetical protein